jgi:hypothetical protein
MKKSQANIMHTIAILLMFSLILLVFYIFYYNISKQDLEKTSGVTFDALANKIAIRAVGFPPYKCASGDCIDKYKAISFSELAKDNDYFEIFGFSKIILEEIFPSMDKIIIYENVMEDFRVKKNIRIPVTIYEPVNKTKSFGVLIVEVFSK